MYKCLDCGNVFEEPKKIGYGIEKEYVCPICGEEYYEEAERCGNPGCMNYTVHGSLCVACKAELLARVKTFFDGLTEAEEEQFDEWMDGESITGRDKWNVEDE